jgi:hypothetical protein
LAYKEFYKSGLQNTVSDTVSAFRLEMPLHAALAAPTPLSGFRDPRIIELSGE